MFIGQWGTYKNELAMWSCGFMPLYETSREARRVKKKLKIV